MRLIDADELKAEFDLMWFSIPIKHIKQIIDNAPTVELQIGRMVNGVIIPITRPQGEWITRHKENSFGQDVVCFECNKCGEYKLPIIHTMITEPLGVCPNCGVNMQKGGAE